MCATEAMFASSAALRDMFGANANLEPVCLREPQSEYLSDCKHALQFVNFVGAVVTDAADTLGARLQPRVQLLRCPLRALPLAKNAVTS
jgi:hypothetical protein